MFGKFKVLTSIIILAIFFSTMAGVLGEESSSDSQNSSKGKIVFADFLVVYHSYYKTKQEDEKLEEKGSELKEQIKQEREKIAEMERRMNSGILSEEEKSKLQQEIEKAKSEANRKIQELNLEIESERRNTIEKLIVELREKISKFGEEKGYTAILDKNEVIFSGKNLDITKEIVDYVNKESSE